MAQFQAMVKEIMEGSRLRRVQAFAAPI